MEKRLEKRHIVPTKAILLPSYTSYMECKALDISRNGIFLITGETKPVGSKVFLSLYLDVSPEEMKPSMKPFRIEGTVKRQTIYGMGLAFDHHLKFTRI